MIVAFPSQRQSTKRNGVKSFTERQRPVAGIEHDASERPLGQGSGKPLQMLEIARSNCRSRLDLDAQRRRRFILDKEINLALVRIAILANLHSGIPIRK